MHTNINDLFPCFSLLVFYTTRATSKKNFYANIFFRLIVPHLTGKIVLELQNSSSIKSYGLVKFAFFDPKMERVEKFHDQKYFSRQHFIK